MSEKKKAAPALQHQSGECGQLCLDGFGGKPIEEFITTWEAPQAAVSAYLSRGRGNARTAGELATLTGLSRRQVTLRIMEERRAGAPILSDPAAGFWLAEDVNEVKRCVAALHRRAGQIHMTARALEQIGR